MCRQDILEHVHSSIRQNEKATVMVPHNTSASEPKTGKGERTRQAILSAALQLFQKLGYEQTTMRLIAREAGVSLGNAYHYFQSKEDLMQAYYEDLCQQQVSASLRAMALEKDKSLRARLVATVNACLSVLQPHRPLLSSLFAIAGSPQSRLSPFGPHTRTTRERSMEIFGDVLRGSEDTPPEALREDLPCLLWLYYMGILFFWLHDNSFGWQRTSSLISSSASLLATILVLLKLPAPTPVRKPILDLMRDIRAFVTADDQVAADTARGITG